MNEWKVLEKPSFFTNGIGDAASCLLNPSTFMLQEGTSYKSALLDIHSLTWTQTGINKFTYNNEEVKKKIKKINLFLFFKILFKLKIKMI